MKFKEILKIPPIFVGNEERIIINNKFLAYFHQTYGIPIEVMAEHILNNLHKFGKIYVYPLKDDCKEVQSERK